MYHPKVIERAVTAYERTAKHTLVEISQEKCEDWQEHFKQRLLAPEIAGSVEALEKTLTKDERLFIRNERVMSMVNFRYWASRYGHIERDGGGTCKFTHPWGSQELLLSHIAKLELEMHEHIWNKEAVAQMDITQPLPAVSGILVALNKARQLGATAVGRLLIMHRTTLQKTRRAISASVNDDKIKALYDRDKIVYNNLPFFLKPELMYDEKCAHIQFASLDTQLLYQVSSQKSGGGTSGVGVGRQWDYHHFTELSTWFNADALEVDFFPTLPWSVNTLGLEESTPFGRGNWWHRFTEKIRKGGAPRFSYLFIPVYAEEAKYRTVPPSDWKPNEVSLLYAQKVYDTSPEFVGRRVMVSKEHLYWWEITRADQQKDNNLAFFLTNYSATPEESFQASGQSAFPPELLDEMRLRARPGQAYELRRIGA